MHYLRVYIDYLFKFSHAAVPLSILLSTHIASLKVIIPVRMACYKVCLEVYLTNTQGPLSM